MIGALAVLVALVLGGFLGTFWLKESRKKNKTPEQDKTTTDGDADSDDEDKES